MKRKSSRHFKANPSSRNHKIKVKYSWFSLPLILFLVPIFSKLNSTIFIIISSLKKVTWCLEESLKFRPKTIHKNKLCSSHNLHSILPQFQVLWSLTLILDSCRFWVIKTRFLSLDLKGISVGIGWSKEATTSNLWRVV